MASGTRRWGVPLAAWALGISMSGAAGAHADAPTRVPSDETLARLFVELATGREFERGGRTLRWERPIRYVVMNREPSPVAERAPRALEEFAAIAGIEVQAAPVRPWSDPKAIPDNVFTTDDGFRGHLRRVRGDDVDDDPHFVAVWGRGEDLKRAEAALVILVDDRETLAAQLAGGDRHVEARRRDLLEGRIDCLFFLHENRSFHIVLGLLLLNTGLEPERERACINEETFQALGLINDVRASPLTMLDQEGHSASLTPTAYDRLLLRLLYHPAMETGLDRHWAHRRAMELLPGLREQGSARIDPAVRLPGAALPHPAGRGGRVGSGRGRPAA